MLRFSSGRKSLGRQAAPTHSTSAGRADRTKRFSHFSFVLTVGQEYPYGVRTVGLADKNSIYIKEKTWITVGVIQKQKGVDQ